MKTYGGILLVAVPLLLLSLVVCCTAEAGSYPDLLWHSAPADFEHQIIGTWALVSADGTRRDGGKFQPFGPAPLGRIVFDSRGHVTVLCMPAGNHPAPGEVGILGIFGGYAVNEAERTLVWRASAATSTGWVGQEQRLPIEAVTEEELKLSMPYAPEGILQLTWKRVLD